MYFIIKKKKKDSKDLLVQEKRVIYKILNHRAEHFENFVTEFQNYKTNRPVKGVHVIYT